MKEALDKIGKITTRVNENIHTRSTKVNDLVFKKDNTLFMLMIILLRFDKYNIKLVLCV